MEKPAIIPYQTCRIPPPPETQDRSDLNRSKRAIKQQQKAEFTDEKLRSQMKKEMRRRMSISERRFEREHSQRRSVNKEERKPLASLARPMRHDRNKSARRRSSTARRSPVLDLENSYNLSPTRNQRENHVHATSPIRSRDKSESKSSRRCIISHRNSKSCLIGPQHKSEILSKRLYARSESKSRGAFRVAMQYLIKNAWA